MQFADLFGARQHQVFVAAVQLRTAEVARMQVHALDRSSGGAVEHHDSFREQLAQNFDSFAGGGHHLLGTPKRVAVNY